MVVKFVRNPFLSLNQIAELLQTKTIFILQPDYRHLKKKKKLLEMMKSTRDEDMVSTEVYAALLRNIGYTVQIFSYSRLQMQSRPFHLQSKVKGWFH